MLKNSLRLFFICLALSAAVLVVGGPARAQAEPSINQIYDAAQSGKLDQAQTMVQQVLILHPKSAKAHYVQAELFARQGQGAKGREALAEADKLAPGLPFAKAEAVQALRTQLASKPTAASKQGFGLDTPVTATSSFSPGLLLLLGAAVVGFVVWLIRRKPAAAVNYSAPASMAAATGGGIGSGIGSGLNGPQTFGSGVAPGYAQPAYGQSGQSGQPAYGQQAAGTGMGGRVMGGLANGLAVGAGVLAAQAIGKNLMGNDDRNANNHGSNVNDGQSNRVEALPGNNDLGGQNFGMNDSTSWDDAGGGNVGGGGDWDS